MNISADEQRAIVTVIDLGARFGFGSLISHLNTAWAKSLIDKWGMSEKVAREASRGLGLPFLMQQDLIERGEWDETGKRYRKPKTRTAARKGTR